MKLLRNLFAKKTVAIEKKNKPAPKKEVDEVVYSHTEFMEQELRSILPQMNIVERNSTQDIFTGNMDETVSYLKEKGDYAGVRSNFDYHHPRKWSSPDDPVTLLRGREQTELYLVTEYYDVLRTGEDIYCVHIGTYNDEY